MKQEDTFKNNKQYKSLAYGLPTSLGLNENDTKPINSNVVSLEKKINVTE